MAWPAAGHTVPACRFARPAAAGSLLLATWLLAFLSLFQTLQAQCKFYPGYTSISSMDRYKDDIEKFGSMDKAFGACNSNPACASFNNAGWLKRSSLPLFPDLEACLYVKNAAVNDSCISSSYFWNESRNSLGSDRCYSNCECDGLRTCSYTGWCQGTARMNNRGPAASSPQPSPPPVDMAPPLSNLVLGKPTYASSFPANSLRKATDGRIGPPSSDVFVVTDAEGWLSVNLGVPSVISYIILYARADCCADQLSSAQVRVGNCSVKTPFKDVFYVLTDNMLVWQQQAAASGPGTAPGAVYTIVLNVPVTGRWVTVQNVINQSAWTTTRTNTTLALLELEIWGTEAPGVSRDSWDRWDRRDSSCTSPPPPASLRDNRAYVETIIIVFSIFGGGLLFVVASGIAIFYCSHRSSIRRQRAAIMGTSSPPPPPPRYYGTASAGSAAPAMIGANGRVMPEWMRKQVELQQQQGAAAAATAGGGGGAEQLALDLPPAGFCTTSAVEAGGDCRENPESTTSGKAGEASSSKAQVIGTASADDSSTSPSTLMPHKSMC